jgi:hypothetical protein
MAGAGAGKVEFLSDGWLEAFRAVIAECFAAAGDQSGPRDATLLSESYTGVPAHIAASGSRAFSIRMRDGAPSLHAEADASAIVRIAGEYQSMLPISRFDSGGDPARAQEMNAMVGALIASGKAQATGAFDALPPWIAGLHDKIAAQTA